MSWSSGSGLFCDIIRIVKASCISAKKRKEIYEALIIEFEDRDCDTLYECVGIDSAFDYVWEELYDQDV